MSGLGHGVEAYLAQTTDQRAAATAAGFAPVYEAAAQAIIDAWCQTLPNNVVTLATGDCYTGQPGIDAMTSICEYGIQTYTNVFGGIGFQFAVKSCALSATFPNGDTFIHTSIPLFAGLTAVYTIYQMVGTVNTVNLPGSRLHKTQISCRESSLHLLVHNITLYCWVHDVAFSSQWLA